MGTLRMSLKRTELVNCRYRAGEILNVIKVPPPGIGMSTLSISLQCIYSVPDQDTGVCPQCETLWEMTKEVSDESC